MSSATLLRRITDYANRTDPYPLYAELRRTPVARQDNGTYLVGTYREISGLLHDPRVSSEIPDFVEHADGAVPSDDEPAVPPSMIRRDPPAHDRLRRLTMRPFGPPHSPARLYDMRPQLGRIVAELVDGLRDRDRVDVVEDFAYPFPVTVICRLLGVPREDEPRFHRWTEQVIAAVDPSPGEEFEGQRRAGQQARRELGRYLAGLAEEHRRLPGDDMLSRLATDHGPHGQLSPAEIVSQAVLLLIAGHETTVNLITNGMLTLLRNPEILTRLSYEPRLATTLVEELLRYEPPVHMLPQRIALADIDIAGTTIPKGAPVWLILASGSRDPRRFPEPDRFDPDRRDNQHLGFGGGIHYCFGAALARLETQLALVELARRLEAPRLVEDPPPYRQSPFLRGPRHLPIDIAGIAS